MVQSLNRLCVASASAGPTLRHDYCTLTPAPVRSLARAALAAALPGRPFRRRPWDVAPDRHDVPFYGQPGTPGVLGGPKKGTGPSPTPPPWSCPRASAAAWGGPG
jgi:hypothetical protein